MANLQRVREEAVELSPFTFAWLSLPPIYQSSCLSQGCSIGSKSFGMVKYLALWFNGSNFQAGDSSFHVFHGAVGASSSSTKTSEVISLKSGLKGAAFGGKNEWQSKTLTNGSRVSCMHVWEPHNNKKFETLSYLPPLSQDSLTKQIDYLIANKWHPCIEFDASDSVSRENSRMPGYYDNRYWTMWKLPMFGCTDPSQVLREVAECKAKYGHMCYIRVLGFDNTRQVQCALFIVHRPGQK